MKKKDIMLAIGLLLAAAIIYIVIQISGKKEGNLVLVMVNGKEYGSYSINEDMEFQIKGEEGYNTLVISQGKVYIKDADCPDKYCVNQGKISKSGETLICLPHKLSVEIKKDESSNNIDAIAK